MVQQTPTAEGPEEPGRPEEDVGKSRASEGSAESAAEAAVERVVAAGKRAAGRAEEEEAMRKRVKLEEEDAKQTGGMMPVVNGLKDKHAGKRCRMPGCSRFYRSGSRFCVSHGGGRRCEVASCSKSAQGSTAFCSAHGGGKRCQFEGCKKGARGRSDFCIAHGTQLMRKAEYTGVQQRQQELQGQLQGPPQPGAEAGSPGLNAAATGLSGLASLLGGAGAASATSLSGLSALAGAGAGAAAGISTAGLLGLQQQLLEQQLSSLVSPLSSVSPLANSGLLRGLLSAQQLQHQQSVSTPAAPAPPLPQQQSPGQLLGLDKLPSSLVREALLSGGALSVDSGSKILQADILRQQLLLSQLLKEYSSSSHQA